MRKACAIIANDPVLVDLNATMFAIRTQAKDQVEFLEKRIKTIVEKTNEDLKPVWDKVEGWLREMGHLPEDFSRERYHFGMIDGVLYLMNTKEEASQSGLPQFIIDMLKGK